MLSGMCDTGLFANVRDKGGKDDRNRKRVSEDGSVGMQGEYVNAGVDLGRSDH